MVHVYGGPGFQMITNDFNVNWDDFLVTNRSIAVVKIDGRGSGKDGNNLRFAVKGQLGKYEIDDQIQGLLFSQIQKLMFFFRSFSSQILKFNFNIYMNLKSKNYSQISNNLNEILIRVNIIWYI